MVPWSGIEPPTPSLPRTCSAPELPRLTSISGLQRAFPTFHRERRTFPSSRLRCPCNWTHYRRVSASASSDALHARVGVPIRQLRRKANHKEATKIAPHVVLLSGRVYGIRWNSLDRSPVAQQIRVFCYDVFSFHGDADTLGPAMRH